jgi:hypothetical protein
LLVAGVIRPFREIIAVDTMEGQWSRLESHVDVLASRADLEIITLALGNVVMGDSHTTTLSTSVASRHKAAAREGPTAASLTNIACIRSAYYITIALVIVQSKTCYWPVIGVCQVEEETC